MCITSVRNAQRNCTNQVENTIIAQLYSTSSPLSAFYPFPLHRVLIPYPLRDFPLPYHSMFHLPLRALSSLPLRVISSYTFRGSSSPALRVISNPRSFRSLTLFPPPLFILTRTFEQYYSDTTIFILCTYYVCHFNIMTVSNNMNRQQKFDPPAT